MDVHAEIAPPIPTPTVTPTPSPVPVRTVSASSATLAVIIAFVVAWELSGSFGLVRTPHSIGVAWVNHLSLVLDWSGAKPTPPPVPPSPTPTPPTPTPPVVTGQFWAVGVFDTTSLVSLPQGQRDLFASTTIVSSLAVFDAIWWHYDASDPLVASTKWGKAAMTAGIPALVWVDAKGSVIRAEKLPASEAAIIAEAKALTGKTVVGSEQR